MSHPASPLPFDNQRSLAELRDQCDGHEFFPYDIPPHLGDDGRYRLPLDSEFPFNIALHRLKAGEHTPIPNWHERLEMVFTLDRSANMIMGETTVTLDPGDLLVVDNLQPHHFAATPGLNTRAVVITFTRELVYSPDSPTCDYAFLLPFCPRKEGHTHLLKAADSLAPAIFKTISDLMACYFKSEKESLWRTTCKLHLLQILLTLARRFEDDEHVQSDYSRHRELAQQIAPVFEFVRQNYANRVTLEDAARLAHKSRSQFVKAFRSLTGMTFVDYVTRVRLGHAFRQLRETSRSIAEIAADTGFADQSYFDRRFKQAFNRSPRQFRQDLERAAEVLQASREMANRHSIGSPPVRHPK